MVWIPCHEERWVCGVGMPQTFFLMGFGRDLVISTRLTSADTPSHVKVLQLRWVMLVPTPGGKMRQNNRLNTAG